MNPRHYSKRLSVFAAVGLSITLLAACTQSGTGSNADQINQFTVLSPTASASKAAKLDYLPAAPLGTDGIEIVPSVDPNFVVQLRIDQPGAYKVELSQKQCATGVDLGISTSAGSSSSTTLTLAQPSHDIKVANGEKPILKMTMTAGASNNWYCNVMIRKIG